jgi:hypothetical protein
MTHRDKKSGIQKKLHPSHSIRYEIFPSGDILLPITRKPSPEVIRHSVSKKFRCGTSLFKQNDCRELIVLGLVAGGVTSSFLGFVSSELMEEESNSEF